jgi:hypothetical protein
MCKALGSTSSTNNPNNSTKKECKQKHQGLGMNVALQMFNNVTFV